MRARKFVAICAVGLTGCNAHLFSPPARVAVAESSATVGQDKDQVAVDLGAHGAVFGFNAVHITGAYRRGVTDEVEVGADANWVGIDDQYAVSNPDPNIWSGRLGTKYAPDALGQNLALTAGIGGGVSAAGGFISPDIGVVVAFENDYFVPFASTTAILSQPINSKPVDVSRTEDEQNLKEPITTYGAFFVGGAKIPLSTAYDGVRVSLNFAVDVLWLQDLEKNELAIGLAAGPQVAF